MYLLILLAFWICRDFDLVLSGRCTCRSVSHVQPALQLSSGLEILRVAHALNNSHRRCVSVCRNDCHVIQDCFSDFMISPIYRSHMMELDLYQQDAYYLRFIPAENKRLRILNSGFREKKRVGISRGCPRRDGLVRPDLTQVRKGSVRQLGLQCSPTADSSGLWNVPPDRIAVI